MDPKYFPMAVKEAMSDTIKILKAGDGLVFENKVGVARPLKSGHREEQWYWQEIVFSIPGSEAHFVQYWYNEKGAMLQK